MRNDEAAVMVLMDRVVCAAKGLFHAKDFCPGEDLGQEALACCVMELRAAIKDLEGHTGVHFDTATYVAELMAKRREHETGLGQTHG